jgi:hypothetical protein
MDVWVWMYGYGCMGMDVIWVWMYGCMDVHIVCTFVDELKRNITEILQLRPAPYIHTYIHTSLSKARTNPAAVGRNTLRFKQNSGSVRKSKCMHSKSARTCMVCITIMLGESLAYIASRYNALTESCSSTKRQRKERTEGEEEGCT